MEQIVFVQGLYNERRVYSISTDLDVVAEARRIYHEEFPGWAGVILRIIPEKSENDDLTQPSSTD